MEYPEDSHMDASQTIEERRERLHGKQVAADLAAEAERAIRDFDRASETVSEHMALLITLQQERAGRKTQALVRLCQQPHPVNAAKTYSVTQAEDVLQLDADYAAYKVRVAAAEAALQEADDAKVSALLIAELRLAEYKAVSSHR